MSKLSFIWIPQSDWAMAPSLIVSAKPTAQKDHFEVNIIHPNTKKTLFTEVIKAVDISAALKAGRKIKEDQLSHIKTQYEEKLFIPRPKKGKFALKTRK